MSLNFRTSKEIQFADLFDGRLEKYGIREITKVQHKDKSPRALADEGGCLWAYPYDDGILAELSVSGLNQPARTLQAIAKTFDTDIFSEHEPQYWGFDTQEEWELAWGKMAEEEEFRFHAEIIKYIKGEPNELRPGTVGMVEANIAKDLVAENPGLVSPDKKAELMEAIRQVYEADHAVVIKLDDHRGSGNGYDARG